MDNHLFQLRIAQKTLLAQQRACVKQEKAEIGKLKRALAKNSPEVVKIHAQNAVRKKNEGIACLQLASRVDAAASKVQTAVTMRQLTKTLDGVVKRMEAAMAAFDLEDMAGVMNDFECMIENVDVQVGALEQSVAKATATVTPTDEVDELIARTAEEAGLDLQVGAARVPSATSLQNSELDGMLARLRELGS